MRIIAFLLLPSIAFADCYVVGDLKGYSTREHDEYKIFEDGISSQKFIIEISGENSSVSPNDMKCMQTGAHTLLCLAQNSEGEATIETWAVYPAKEKAIYTKSINGYGKFNGANMFVGNIKGQCN